MYLIPAIDLIDGQCVRLRLGDYQQVTHYAHDPLKLAMLFEEVGLQRLHLVDLDGAKLGKPVNLSVLEKIAAHTRLHIDFGGGIRTHHHVEAVLKAGAHQFTVGSLAVKEPDILLDWLDTYGPERLIIGADVRHGQIAIHGWQQLSQWQLDDFLHFYQAKGVRYVLCTDISRDGTLEGVDAAFYCRLSQAFPQLHIIASGGVSGQDDLQALRQSGVFGVVIGKAIYEGALSIEELAKIVRNSSLC